jgi:hypothetical protein
MIFRKLTPADFGDIEDILKTNAAITDHPSVFDGVWDNFLQQRFVHFGYEEDGKIYAGVQLYRLGNWSYAISKSFVDETMDFPYVPEYLDKPAILAECVDEGIKFFQSEGRPFLYCHYPAGMFKEVSYHFSPDSLMSTFTYELVGVVPGGKTLGEDGPELNGFDIRNIIPFKDQLGRDREIYRFTDPSLRLPEGPKDL